MNIVADMEYVIYASDTGTQECATLAELDAAFDTACAINVAIEAQTYRTVNGQCIGTNPSGSLQRVFREDCLKFYEANKDLIERAIESTGHSEARLGHDFWLTRNHHGAGFWDGRWGELGDALDAACEEFGDCELYTGDDNLIYVSGAE